MKRAKGVSRVPETSPDPLAKKYASGVTATIFMMRVFASLRERLVEKKELTKERKIEVETAFGICQRVLREAFRVPDDKIARIWAIIDVPRMLEVRDSMFKNMTAKIVIPGPGGEGNTLIMPQLDERGVRERIRLGAEKERQK